MLLQSALAVTLVMFGVVAACRSNPEEAWPPPSTITTVAPARDDAPPVVQPRVLPTAQVPTGSLAQALVQKTRHRHRNELRFCFESQAQSQSSAPPLAASALLVEASIAMTGQVTSVGVVSRPDGMSDKLERCLVNAVKRWTFPAPSGGEALVELELSP